MERQKLGRYELNRMLATGGMAEIWLATNTDNGSTVVIKRVLAHLQDPNFSKMLKQEARLLTLIEHPNIVRVLELCDDFVPPFIVMEYVDGTELTQLLRETVKQNRRVPVRIALRIAHDVCLALSSAHSAMDPSGKPMELVHRDVSPQNVMVTVQGNVKLLDFGIVKAPDHESLTTPGTIKGKFAYMSPEQAADQKLDGRSDLFAAGLILYELLALRRAYSGETDAATFQAALEGRVDSIFVHAPDLPSEVRQLVTRALDKQPDRRFQTAESFAEAIQSLGPMASSDELATWRRELTGEPAAVQRATDQVASLAPKEIAKAPVRVEAPVAAGAFSGPDSEKLELDLPVPAPAPVRESAPAPERPVSVKAPPPKQSGSPVVVVLVGLAVVLVFAIGGGLIGRALNDVLRKSVRERETTVITQPPEVMPEAADPIAMTDPSPGTTVVPSDVRPTLAPVQEAPHFFIDSIPSGATLKLNGIAVGLTPWGGDGPVGKPVTLELQLKGYKKWTSVVAAGEGRVATIPLKK